MTAAFLVIDKPAGITSHDVVAAVRAVTGVKKVGHTGTLDPFATGVLPLALGTATRLIQFLDESIKVYDATVELGTRTDTGDPTGTVVETKEVPAYDEARLRSVLESFIGERQQVPPDYSAVKVDGRPLYSYARAGEKVKAKARTITIRDMELVEFDAQRVRVRITCSRGTYARVLAEEIGEELETVGHLCALSRLRSGPFFLDDAVSFPQLAEWVAAEAGHDWKSVLLSRGRRDERVKWRPRSEVFASLQPHLRSPVQALSHLPLVDVDSSAARSVRNGTLVPAPPPGTGAGGRYLVVNGATVVSIVEATSAGPKALKVLPAP